MEISNNTFVITGAVEELADAVNFIIRSDYFTGQILELDGGLRM